MARGYRRVDRDQVLLLPPDMREWLDPDHLVWLILDAVAAVDTSAFHVGRRTGGAGRAGWDPDVLLALLLYCYCEGERSSRRIEARCVSDVACRVITGNVAPDHTVIARFRERHTAAFTRLFAQVLGMCARAGMVRLGTVALDGTKVAANASRVANRTREQLAAEAARIVGEAAGVDAAEDDRFGQGRGDELAGELSAGGDRVSRLRRCLAELDDDAAASPGVAAAQRRVDKARAAVARERQRLAAARDGSGQDPGPGGRPEWVRRAQRQLDNAQAALEQAKATPAKNARGHAPKRNVTDPESRLLRSQGAWVQGYNAQAAVSEDGVVVACGVTNNAADATVGPDMLDRLHDTIVAADIAGSVGTVTADAGYASEEMLTRAGPDRLMPVRSNQHSVAAEAMRQRLDTPEGRASYRKRLIVEAAFGDIKHNQRFRQFSSRGLAAAEAEWSLVCTARNLRLLHRRAKH